MIQLTAEELADMTGIVHHMTTDNLITQLKEQGEVTEQMKSTIELTAATASLAIANAITYLQQIEQRREQQSQGLKH